MYQYVAEYYRAGLTLEVERTQGHLVAAGGLCAFKFHDEDGNGEFDQDNEELLSGWEMCAEGPEDLGCELTDEDGVVCWFFIDPGTYTVCETLQAGWESTTGGVCQEVELVEDDVAKVLFGNRMPSTPSERSSWGEVKSRYTGE